MVIYGFYFYINIHANAFINDIYNLPDEIDPETGKKKKKTKTRPGSGEYDYVRY